MRLLLTDKQNNDMGSKFNKANNFTKSHAYLMQMHFIAVVGMFVIW
jgi:hypothetical protein